MEALGYPTLGKTKRQSNKGFNRAIAEQELKGGLDYGAIPPLKAVRVL